MSWKYELKSLSGSYQKVDFDFKCKHLLLQAIGGQVTFSFNGIDDAGVLEVADGAVLYPDAGQGHIWAKGASASLKVTAWD
jgi:hypothetical protein